MSFQNCSSFFYIYNEPKTHIKHILLVYDTRSCIENDSLYVSWHLLNTVRPKQNYWHFTDEIFKCIFFNKNVWISLTFSLKFVPNVPIDNILAMVQIMARRHYLNLWWLVYWRIDTLLGLNELTQGSHPIPVSWNTFMWYNTFFMQIQVPLSCLMEDFNYLRFRVN